MKASRFLSIYGLFLVLVFFTNHPAKAQAKFLCDVTCGPDPTDTSYGTAAAARSTVHNARGYSSPIVARMATVRPTANSAPAPQTVVGSQSYNYAIPILTLAGRADMDLVLNLYYNSGIWSVDTAHHTAALNIDRDFPSYGFRLDFGFVERAGGGFIVTASDGAKHLLTLTASGKYDSTDGTYMEYNSQTNVLVYKNGLSVQYLPFPSNAGLFRPVWIKDVNGNYISIAYVSGHDQFIYQISDTLGRVITFNYDAQNHLTSLSQLVHPSGSQTYVTFQWGTATLNYAFAAPLNVIGTASSGSTINVITGCTYPNGTGYRFTYGDWGIINKIEDLSAGSTPVTRSYISYDYPLASAGALGDAPTYTTQTVSPDGTSTNASAWTYAVTKSTSGAVTSMAITDPNGNVITTTLDGTTSLPTSIARTDNAKNTLQTVATTWTTSGVGSVPQIIQTTNDAGQSSKIQYTYDSNGNALTVSESDFDGTVKRITATTYSSAYAAQHILNLPTVIKVEDGGSNVIARTDLAYDSTTLASVTGVNDHDDQAYGSSFTARGNLTAVTRYTNAAAATGAVTRNLYYDSLGNVITAQLDCCNQKQLNFSSVTQYSAPDSIVRGPSGGTQFTTSYTYNPDNNLLLSSTDENGQTTTYEYDAMNRLTEVTLPAQNGTGAQVDVITAYADDTASPTITKSNGADSLVNVTTLDGLGHVLEVDSKNGSTLISSVKYGYDKVWQRIQASNPFAPADTQVNTTFSYDALGRMIQLTPPSGGSMQYSYSGNAVTITDPAGKPRKNITDALGRMVEVDEPIPGTPVNSGSGSATVSGTEQSAQVLVTPAIAGTGSVTLGGTVQWASVSSSATTGGTTNITVAGAEQQQPVGITPGTGSVTISGSEQVIPASTASATVTVGGSLQSEQVQTQVATQATARVTVSGSEQMFTETPPCESDMTVCPPSTDIYDGGSVTITVNGHPDTVGYGYGDDQTTIAAGLAKVINGDGAAPVNASASGAIVYLAARTAGAAGNNLSLSSSSGNSSVTDPYTGIVYFTSPSFSTSNSASFLSGGQDAAYKTVYDFGSATITANNHGDQASWSGSGTTAASIASSLASAINGDNAASVKASASGGNITLIAKTPGAAGNVLVGCSSSYDSTDFAHPSFTFSCPSALSGGKDAIYDAGTVKLTVNGHADSYNFGAGDTPASIASGLAANINADGGAAVSASASGATVNLSTCFPYATSCSPGGRTTLGSIANYTINPPTVSYDTTDFSRPSFAAAAGPSLTGGWPNPKAIDSGTMTVTITPAGATSGTNYQVSWGQNSTSGSIASQLASALSSDPTVKPTLSGGTTVYLDPKTPGASYSFSTAFTYDSGDFTHSSFSPANSISDYGRSTITVNGHQDSVTWAGHDTPTSIAANLAGAINGDSPFVNASPTNGAVALAAKSAGANTNYSLAPPPAETFDTAHFTSASFSSTSGAALTGGADAVYKTVYDSGTVWVEVNGFQASAPYQQGSTVGAIASALASQFTGAGSPVTATVSGATLTLTATQKGSATNYSLSSGSTTSQSATFAQPSFAASVATTAGVTTDALTGGSDASPTWQATTYSYNVLNNLTQVTQGTQTRSYGYDSLSRVGTATTPESGTVTTYYTDVNGNACAGDLTLACRVTDARGITKTLTYDGINRITGVSYSDATPSVTYQYDSGGAAAFALDRITKMTEGADSLAFTYDNFGRIATNSQVIDGTTYSVQYGYNLAGQTTSITYPSGRVVTDNLDAIGRLASISDGTTTYVNNLTYNAAGETLGLTLGNQVQAAFSYNDHLQLATLRYFLSGAAQDVLNLQYDYGANNNGQIASIRYFTAPGEQNEDTTKSEYFTYDLLERLVAAHTGQVTASSTATPTWALSWNYDRWGNRLSQALIGGTASVGQPNFTVDPNTNRITNSGFAYDAAGNMTNDSVNAYTFDGANRMTQVGNNAATYAYFGPLRIKKIVGSTTTTYIYSGSKPIAEYVNGAVTKEYIYAGANLVATLAGGSVTYHHPDHLSNRAETGASGNPVRSFGHFPFGETWYETGTPDKWKFTSYENDSSPGESGLNYAQFRYQSAGLGRFTSADRMAGSLDAPQSLNRYSYVLNDPVNLLDPLGLGSEQGDCADGSLPVRENGGRLVCVIFLPGEDPSGFGGGGGNKKPAKKPCPSNLKNFFDTLGAIFKDMSNQTGVDARFFAALSSYESGWLGTHAQDLQNPFGLTNAGGNDLQFDSYTLAERYWLNKAGRNKKGYAGVVANDKNIADFAKALHDAGYNNVTGTWTQDVIDQLKWVDKWMKICDVKL
jgi:RHS repeat-associated protein